MSYGAYGYASGAGGYAGAGYLGGAGGYPQAAYGNGGVVAGGYGGASYGGGAVQTSRAQGANPEYSSYGVPTTGPDFSQANTPEDPQNLFIQNLPLDVDEAQLRAMFEPFGQVISTKIMTDPNTQASRGFGFVKFTSPTSATTAIESMHDATVRGKKLSVKHAALTSRSANVGASAVGTANPNLYIRGLPISMTSEDLQTLFSTYGTIEQSRILMDQNTGQSKGQAFVRYDTTESATYAIQALNGYTFDNQLPVGLLVKYADTDAEKANRRGGFAGGRGGRADFSSGRGGRGGARFAPYAGGAGHYQGSFGQDGAADTYFLAGNGAYAQGAGGYGYQGGAYGGQAYGGGRGAYGGGAEGGDRVGPVGPNGEGNLFIYHLPANADENLLTTLFQPYGQVVSTRVMRDAATGLCKGFGFVKMNSVDAGNAAIQALNGYQIENKRLQVSFKK